MPPFFKSNHLKLIDACYAVDLGSGTTTELPGAVSNSLGKLTFYASGRPKKIPKVTSVLLERAEKIARAAQSGGVNSKARGGLAVTLDVMRALVVECRDELSCFVAHALRCVELGLTRNKTQQRDVPLEAKAASLFIAVSIYSTAPFQSLNDEAGKLYLRCVALISSLAQLTGDQTRLSKGRSRPSFYTRLRPTMTVSSKRSHRLCCTTSSTFPQTNSRSSRLILSNFVRLQSMPTNVSPHLTFVSISADDDPDSAFSTVNVGPLADRKVREIEPSNEPSSGQVGKEALDILRSLAHLSHGAQLSSMLTAMGNYLDRARGGALWKERTLVTWLGKTIIAACPVQYRATVVGWWLDMIVEIDDTDATPKSEALLYTLAQILRGPTSLVGLGIGGVLNQLTSLVVKRCPWGDKDPLTKPLLATISSLASSHVYYVDQVNDIVSDLIEALRSVRDGAGVAARLNERERFRALRQLSGALKQVLLEAAKSSDSVKIAVPVKANGVNGHDTKSRTVSTTGQKDDFGRPKMRVAEAGKRNRISPEVFMGSLFLLTQNDAIARTDYERALLLYVANELAIPEDEEDVATDSTSSFAKFCRALFTSIQELALSPILRPAVNNYGRALSRRTSGAASVRSRRSRRRRSSSAVADSLSSVASAADYAALIEILRSFIARKSATAVVNVVPMLIALQKSAARWGSTAEADGHIVPQTDERTQACRELVAQTFHTIGEVWGATETQRLAAQAVYALSPSVLPRLGASTSGEFAARASTVSSQIDLAGVIDGLASSLNLQQAAGQGLGNALVQPWQPEILVDVLLNTGRALGSGPYGQGNRSVTNLSNVGLNRGGSMAERRSLRAPSLVDLQSSLGSRAASARGSAAASIASTNAYSLANSANAPGTGAPSGRRTSKAKASAVLERLSVSAAKKTSVVLPQALRGNGEV
ncbi:BZ3500_MvSof-1268-A1-R1_Chr1-2g01374 [Microbotryum saponariae]|uniref:BZ3500_MvSof-1268-A1-R1_Chr1-2g01374 protein n=1 Tax=Microbotryum saponariae TaxID=289078 RepID=A0A2X0KTK6_9BASI|nr:BZ3500_MvSof-1268-A1-R1_Chr1-2g01374 [Microbotryum saponariae]SCZ97242.1 BZ3501_MvSof-1269-A2-R1_Chr1-2g00973 [Microbotryum saponariae]